ncbi:MAG: hypothetical protein H7308_20230 [Chthonomonadaceae bacterium]|nr:hypothetical protein [Chthonomonadaceae bacterium]
MKPILRLIFVTEAILFLSFIGFAARPAFSNQSHFMLSFLLLLPLYPIVFFGLFFAQNKPFRPQMAIALLLAPLALFVGGFLGSYANTYLYYRDLPRMKEVVALLQNRPLTIRREHIDLPAQYKDLAYVTQAGKDSQGVMTVLFIVGSGFPTKHTCYLYRSDDKISPELRAEWHSSRHRENNWFQVSD